MGFISNTVRSLCKSVKLRRLQLKIAPPKKTVHYGPSKIEWYEGDLAKWYQGHFERKVAFEKYLILCMEDPYVAEVMDHCGLTKKDLENIFSTLQLYFGHWIKGHYVPLSTIAYPEPLYFYSKSIQQGKSPLDLIKDLNEYWNEEIPYGSLIKKVR